jgi:hypothetical protein
VKSPLAVAIATLLLVAACGGGSDTPNPTDTPTPTASPRPNPTIINATETPGATDTPGATSTAAPTATSTAQPTGTATAVPTATTGPAGAEDAQGFPFGTADVRAAVEARGFGFQPVEDRAPLCPTSSVEGHAFWSADLAGSDSGPVLVLWVYEDPSALRDDWIVEPGSAPAPRFDCELPFGFVYWNENLALALETWLAAGFDVPIGNERPSDHPAVQGFLSLTR